MKKLPKYGGGKRINIWLPNSSLVMWNQIENGSRFVQIALEDAIGIMTWALLMKADPEKYEKRIKNKAAVLGKFNEEFPLDPMTQARKGTKPSPAISPPTQELW